jgi:hypothetical protein
VDYELFELYAISWTTMQQPASLLAQRIKRKDQNFVVRLPTAHFLLR